MQNANVKVVTKRPFRWNAFKPIKEDPTTYLAISIVAIFLIYFILYPVLRVISYPDSKSWSNLFSQARYIRIFKNSISVTALTTVSSTFIGFCFAYALTRHDFPLRGFFRTISILPLISPPFVSGLAFILLFGRRGLITYGLLGQDVSIYGWHGIWLAQTIAYFPVAALAISGVLKGLNPTLEYAARDLGQNRWGVFKTVVLPLSVPGLASAGLLVSMFALSDFGNPLLVGGNFRVLATEAYMQVIGMSNLSMAAVVSVVLLVPTVLIFLIQRYWVEKKQYITVTGKGSTLDPLPTPTAVKWFLFAILGFVSLIMVSVYLVVIWGAFSKTWGVDWTLTTANFEYTWMSKIRDLWNSTYYALIASIGTAIFSILSAYVLYRKSFTGRKVLDFLAVLPAALPGTMVGIAWILAFNSKPFVLTGTATIVILCMLFRNLPLGYRSGVSALRQIDSSIEESTADLGANTFRTFMDVVLPLLKPSLTASLVYAFLKSINTVSAVIFLVSPGNNVASASIVGLAEHGYWGQAAALATVLMCITVSVLLLFRLVGGGKHKLFDL